MNAVAIPIVLGLALVLVAMTGLYIVQEKQKRADWVDFGWTLSIGFFALWFSLYFQGDLHRRIALLCMVVFWSGRLSYHIASRSRLLPFLAKGHGGGHALGEDPRYAKLRAMWKERSSVYFFWIFVAQGFLALFLALPFAAILADPRPFGRWDLVACVLAPAAMFGEWLSDRQLRTFRQSTENRGKTCRAGLWRYSRHPNYFFEWLFWVAIAWLAWPASFGWTGLLSAGCMYLLLTKVTGIPPAEARSLEHRGDDYRQYQCETSAFFPWFVKRMSSKEHGSP